MSSQAPANIKSLMKERVKQVPGPQGGAANADYMTELVGKCDALAMFDNDGSLMWAWSQDKLHGWYWHADVKQADNMYSTFSYDYTQGDGSKLHITNETDSVAKFMRGEKQTLFFNGCKFHVTRRDLDPENSIDYAVVGGQDGRGLHTAVAPNKECMVVAMASAKALPAERFMGIDCGRPAGPCQVDQRQLGGAFRVFAPGALGI